MKTFFLSALRFDSSQHPVFSQRSCNRDANRARRTRYVLTGSGNGKINMINVHKYKIHKSFSIMKDILEFIEKNCEAM